MFIEFKRDHPDAEIPTYAHDGDVGLDLRTMEDVTLKPGETKTVSLGLSVKVPKGYAGLIFPRSGLGSRGLTLSNCVGVIDQSYRGTMGAPLHNNHPPVESEDIGGHERTFRSSDVMHVSKGDRVCQFVLVKCETPTPVEVKEWDGPTERGTDGFGSTGV